MSDFAALLRALLWGACVSVLCLNSGPARGQTAADELEGLRSDVQQLRDENLAMQDQLAEALRAIQSLRSQGGSGPGLGPSAAQSTVQGAARRSSPPPLQPRLADLSLVTNFAVGSSTARDDELVLLQAGEHDPRQRGFTLQQVELALIGAVDPYFTGEMYLIYFLTPEGESVFELEEAFLRTQALPFGLQLEAGTFFTEFGHLNPRHPHFWHWQEQPVALSRMFGPEGMRGPGMRLAWLTELPWYSELHFTLQNADGETMVSFLSTDEFENALGDPIVIGERPFVSRDVQSLGDMVYTTRWQNAFEVSDTVSASLGLSGAYGPNASGPDGDTWIYGADAVLKWLPANQRRGWPFFVLEGEYLFRNYHADDNPAAGLTSDTLRDWGGYVQGLYGFRPRWAAGLRLEYASGSGPSVGGRSNDPFRDDRFRAAPLLAFYPSEYSRIRLQYNYDRATQLSDDDAHTVWLGFEFTLGAHPAHLF